MGVHPLLSLKPLQDVALRRHHGGRHGRKKIFGEAGSRRHAAGRGRADGGVCGGNLLRDPVHPRIVGLGAAWLSGIAALADPYPYKRVLIGVAAVTLLAAVALFVRQRVVIACTPGAVCAKPGFRAVTPVLLVAGGILAWLAFRIG